MVKNYVVANKKKGVNCLKVGKLSAFVAFVSFLGMVSLQAQTPVTAINTNAVPATATSYTVGGDTYNWGLTNDLFLVSVAANGDIYTYESTLVPNLSLIRVDNPNSSGFRSRVFAQVQDRVGAPDNIDATIPTANGDGSRMEDALLQPIINRGALDVFHNLDNTLGNSQAANNIERVDVLYTSNVLVAPSNAADLIKVGFIASEKSGNNDFKIAAITAIDPVTKQPTAYGNLVLIDGTNAPSDFGIPNPPIQFRFVENEANPVQGNMSGVGGPFPVSNEQIGITLVTLDQLGISTNQQIFGVSFFGFDVDDSVHNLLDPTTFPLNTFQGADIHGGLGSIATASVLLAPADEDGDGIATLDEDLNGNGILTDDDTDGDGVPNYLDQDDDGDGILTIVETNDDTADGDGVPNHLDLDSDDDGIPDNIEAQDTATYSPPSGVVDPVSGIDFVYLVGLTPVNTDTDTIQDYLDSDSDNDGLTDIQENGNTATFLPGADTDGDGINDAWDNVDVTVVVGPWATNGNIINGVNPADLAASFGDDDADGILNFRDFDSDGDGVNDDADLDADNDGIPNIDESGGNDPLADDDSDGIPNWQDTDGGTIPDANGDGIPDIYDADGDGIPNHLDLDSDGDGISDIIEAGGIDSDNDGKVDTFTDTTPQDGIDDTLATTPLTNPDTDGDGVIDMLDLDSDNDGILDAVEGVVNSDSDSFADRIDLDSDNDGIPDNVEAQLVGSYITPIGTVNANGIDTAYDPVTGGTTLVPVDTDLDTIPDYIDTDSDGDGTSDSFENGNPAANIIITNADSDQDGIDDVFDTVNAPLGTVWVPTNINNNLNPPSTTNLGDVDLDVIVDFRDADSDNDSVNDNADLDADNDGISNIDESGGNNPLGDADGDGIPNWQDTTDDGGAGDGSTTDYIDADGNGIPDVYDADGDGIPNHIDVDSDNDGINDIEEAGGVALDSDGDGRIDAITDTTPQDGIDDTLAGTPLPNIALDTDGDGVLNMHDVDSDNDGIPDGVEGTGNKDADTGDTLPNYLDLDSDGDGISDIIEAGGTDADNDGHVDYPTSGDPTTMTDANNNGMADAVDIDPAVGGTPLTIPNTDTTGDADYLDIDSDDDGIVDIIEGQTTVGYLPPRGVDSDGDGLDDEFDGDNETIIGIGGGTGTAIVPNVTLGDPDYINTNSDGDLLTDNEEGANLTLTGLDDDGDGLDNVFDADDSVLNPTNNGQTPSSFPDSGNPGGERDWRYSTDSDGDGIADATDLDDDNDGIPDAEEGGDTLDTDGDGVPNRLDIDSDNDGIYDVVEGGLASFDTNFDGVINTLTSVGTNGLFDAIETAPDSGTRDVATFPIPDSSTDISDPANPVPAPNGIYDFLELDSDTDGCFDVIEAGYTDGDGDNVLGNSPVTVNGNGKVTSATDGYTTPASLDGNAIFDFQEFVQLPAITDVIPTPTPVLVGDNLTITANPIAGNQFRWQVSTDGTTFTDVADGEPGYSGQDTAVLTINNVSVSLNGNFYKLVISLSNYACTYTPAESNAVQVTIQGDADGDLVPDVIDLDDDNDGIPDTVEEAGGIDIDFDGDGVPNRLDLDSDNDGIYDIVESGLVGSGLVLDNIVDGRIDGANDTTVGANGLFNAIETDDTNGATVIQPTSDSNGNGIVDSNELNADSDTFNLNDCFDNTEAGFGSEDSDNNGRLGFDGSLVVDPVTGVVDLAASGLTLGYTQPLDFDGNGTYDFQVAGIGVESIMNPPTDATVVINAPAVFTVDGQPVTFQWQQRENSTAPWVDITDAAPVLNVSAGYSGATTNQLTLTMIPGSYNGYQYQVILSSPGFVCDTDQTSVPVTLTVYPDHDGDGVGDPVDVDTDNDGIPDISEYPENLDPLFSNPSQSDLRNPYNDFDVDGSPNYLDPQPNNISVIGDGTTVNPAYDTDGDTIPNHLDPDSDGDGIYDAYEAGHGLPVNDSEGSIADANNTTVGANGLYNPIETNDTDTASINYPLIDSDNNGTSNFLDEDDDGDGIETKDEAPDENGDGNPDDAQNTDADTLVDYLDIDDDNDGILTSLEGRDDIDGDSKDNYLDLDSDGDGIADIIEAQTTAGYIAPSGTVNAQGLDTAYEATNGLQPVNSDAGQPLGGDATPDYLDTDSDGDTVPDSTEAHDYNFDGNPDVSPAGDTDGDGLDNSYDATPSAGYATPNGTIANPADMPNTDGTADVNFRDQDDDDDTVFTNYEVAEGDTDGNNIPNYMDNDDDGDNVLTINENPDPNGDGNPVDAQNTDSEDAVDYLDNDDDNDTVPTKDEVAEGDTDPMNFNSDGDTRANYLDIDDDGDGILTSVEVRLGVDTDNDGILDYLDLDADGDGIPDNVEGQTTEGYENPNASANPDVDNDGLNDAYDNNLTVGAGYPNSGGIDVELVVVDTDDNGEPDYIDIDADGDGVLDAIEGHDFNADGIPDVEPEGDTDKDGLDDAYDGSIGDYADPNGLVITDNPQTQLPNRDLALEEDINYRDIVEGDNLVDYRDTDDDGDGRPTREEDTNQNGDWADDNCDSTDPTDNDSFPDYLDATPCIDYVPNGFSPNGDGDNDVFIIPDLSRYTQFTIQVYNRWGNLVYEYDNNGRPVTERTWWNGFSSGTATISKGKKVPVGTYYYVIEYNEGGKAPRKGWVYVNY